MTMATSRADDDDDGADNGGGGDSIPPSAVADDGGEEGPLPAAATVAVARSRRREEIQQLLRQQQHPDIGVPSSAYSSPRIMTMGDRSTDDDQDNIDEVDKTAIVAGEGGRQQQRQLDNDGDDDDLLFPGGRVLRNSQRLFTRLDSDENNEMATLFHSTSTASGTLAGQNLVGIGNNNNNNAGGGIATPLLNGENIVLLSYSNETTPSGQLTMSAIADQLYGDDDNNGGVAGIRQRRRSHPQRIIADESDQIRNNRDDMPQSEELHTEDHEEGDQDMTLSPNSFIGDLESTDVMMMASSPPPESVHSGVLTSLSPPPLSIKSAGGGAGGGGGVGPYYVPPSSSGSVGLFSRGEHPPASSVVSGGVGSGVGGGGNGLNYGAAPPKENWRPPLPPRWAIPGGGGTQGTAGLASPHHGGVAAGPPPPQPQQQQTRAVDVVPTHLPPLPKQIGQLHHRRVLSTGDASLLSNLTDPDSIPDLGEEHSPTQPPGSTTFATANNTGAGGGNGGMERAFFPVVPGPSQTTTSLSAKPLTMNPPHRRGVSWAAFGGSDGGGGDGDAWLSSSYSLNRFRSEEEATFDTLGILQPILHDGDGDEDINKFLMQPVLGDENDNMAVAQQPAMIGGMGSAFESANAAAVGVDTTVPPSPLPPPPPPASPPERVTRILDDESNNQSTAKKRERNISQFEYEAQMAILEALNEQQNMTSIDMRDHPMYAEDASGERIEEPAPDIEPDFQSWISPNSAEGSLPLDQQHDNSRSLFENSAWTSEYDARGRIDGTLPEERDAKLVEIDMKQLVDDVPSVAVIKSHAPTVQEQTATDKESDNSPRSILKSHDAAKDINVPTDGTDATGLRHRKVKSIAAKSMADELAALAAMHGGVTKTDAPALTKDGGIDNLLAGVVSLAQQEGGKHQSQEQPTTSANANDSDGDAGEEDSPRDEETGDAKQIIRGDNAGYNFGASGGWSSRSSLGRQGSEKLYYLRGWYHELIKPKLPAFWTGATHFVCFTMLPLLTVAFILYYAAGNPMAGGATVEAIMDATEGLDNYEYASWSWWALFFVRQAFVLAYIRTVEVFTIDILALRTSIFLKTFGSFATLMFAQARGWPYVLTFWSIADFCVLFGNHQFARHWLYWQDSIDLFNASNPAGSFLHSEFYMRALLAMLFVGVSTSLKRLWLATFLGRRSYAHYSSSLEVILAKMLLVSQVSHFARQIEQMIGEPDSYMYSMHPNSFAFPESSNFILKSNSADSEDETSYPSLSSTNRDGFGKSLLDAGFATSQSRLNLNPTNNAKGQPSTSASTKLELKQLVGEWEEPDYKCPKSTASIKDILQFRQAVSMMDDTYPFTPAFGPAKTRAMCVESSERLYDTLMKNTPNEKLLPFETLSRIAYDSKGQLMRDKTKALIKLFRPNRQGYLTKLEFVSSVDDVYRELRLFRASLANSSSIDDVFELIINIIFYIISFFLVLLIVGFEVWEPILSFSAFFFSFSFMFGPASSKYFEGILLIFVRRPYDIGDKIALSDPEVDTSPTGSSTWFVEKVTIFTTTVRFASTNEVATYSNGSLARLRIINAKRSPKAVVCVYVKFGSNSSFDMIKLFQNVVESFIKARPREWAQLNGIQATRVEMELNYIEYVISATHREMWQNIGPIKASQADLASFALEVSKRLNLRYQSPPKPIHLSVCKREKKEQQQQQQTTTDGITTGNNEGVGSSDTQQQLQR